MLNVEAKQNGAQLTLEVSGRLDTTTSPELEAVLSKMDPAVTDLTFDFTGLEYVSSAGLRVLLNTQKTMSQKGSLTLTGVNANVMEVFEITGFSDILTIK